MSKAPVTTFLLAISLVVLMLIRVSAGQVDALTRAELPNPDSYYKLVLLRVANATPGWAWSARDNAPDGFWMHWSEPHSQVMQAMAGGLKALGMAPESALLWAGGVLTMLSMALLAAALLWLLAQHAGRLPTLMVAIALATSIPLFGYAQLVQITHHIFMLVPVAWALLGLHGRQHWLSDARSGALLGLALWISPETMPLVLVLSALRALQRLITPTTAPIYPWGVGLVLVALLAYGIDPPAPSVSLWALDHVSLAWLSLVVLLALIMLLIDMLSTRAPYLRWAGAIIAVLCAMALWLRWVPGALDGPMGVLPESLRLHWWGHIHELQPAHELADGVAYGTLPIVAAMLCLWVAWQQRQPWFGFLACAVLAYGVLGLMHIRMGSASAVLACYALGLALGQLALFRQASQSLTRAQQAFVVMMIGVIPGQVFLAQALDKPPSASPVCRLAPAAAELNHLPAGTLLLPINQAPELLYRTHHRVISGNYHRNVDGLQDYFALWLGLQDAPSRERILAKRQLQYVLLCPHDRSPSPMMRAWLMQQLPHQQPLAGDWQLLSRKPVAADAP